MSIAVIIPTWNRAVLLERAVRSVLAQTLLPDELIIVDDGSSDNTADIVDAIIANSYTQKNKNPNLYSKHRTDIRFLQIEHSGLPGKVRNHGIRAARSDWIALLDSDDEWLPQKLALQMETLLMHKTRWCHTKERWLRGGQVKSQSKMKHATEGDVFLDSLQKCIVGPSTVLISKELFEECGFFRDDLEVAEDYELWLRFSERYPISYVAEECIIKHAGHGDQLSEKYGYIEIFRIRALEQLISKHDFCYNRIALLRATLEHKQKIWRQGQKKRKNKTSEAF